MRNVAEVLDLWPSLADLGRDISVSYPTLAAWKQRGSIPAAYWRDIVRSAQRRGLAHVTADLLMELHARQPAVERGGGFGEEADAPFQSSSPRTEPSASPAETGHFTRWKHLRRSNFASAEEIVEHVRALRDEWEHR